MKKLLAVLALGLATATLGMGGTASASGGPFYNLTTLGRDITRTVNHRNMLEPYHVVRTSCSTWGGRLRQDDPLCYIFISAPENHVSTLVHVSNGGRSWRTTDLQFVLSCNWRPGDPYRGGVVQDAGAAFSGELGREADDRYRLCS